MTQSAYHPEEHISSGAILIVDKHGLIGEEIFHLISRQKPYPQVVLISNNVGIAQQQDLLIVPYSRAIPFVPHGNYSHIMVIYSGEDELLDSISEFVQEAKSNKAKLVYCLPLCLAREQIISAILSSYKASSVVIVGELFGRETPYEYGQSMQALLWQAKEKKVLLAQMGMVRRYPVRIDDAASCMLQVLFQVQTAQRVFFLFPPFPPTELTIVRMLKKADPFLIVDFAGQNIRGNIVGAPSYSGAYLIEKYPLEKKLKEIIDKIKTSEMKIKKLEITHSKNNSHSILSFKTMVLFVLVLLFLPLFSTVAFLFVGTAGLINARQAIDVGDIKKTKMAASTAVAFFSLAENTGRAVVYGSKLVEKKGVVNRFIKNIELGKDVALLLREGSDAVYGYASVFSGKSLQPRKDFDYASGTIKKALRIFQKITAEKNTVLLFDKFSPERLEAQYKGGADMFGGIVDVLPALLGFEGKREYLLLFQNNMELRPGGGFIGSYGLASFENGRMINFSIQDVYDADGQLKGHVEPPFPIRRYIPNIHWYLRDSNFSADFTKNASMSAFFLQQEIGKRVDGVVGVDVSFVRGLLDAIGPVYVSSYNQTASADNLYMLTQSYAEKDFFPGSRQKKDFLNALFAAIQVEFTTRKNIPYVNLLQTLCKAIVEKHIQLAVNDSGINNVFVANNLSGTFLDKREKRQEAINDYVGISEANLGGNKANYFVKRKVSYDVSIDGEGSVSAKLSISYKNTSKQNEWPGGDYKNYIRIIVPLGAKLTEVVIDGVSQRLVPAITDPAVYEAKNFVPPDGLEIEESQETQKTVFGFLVVIPPDKLRTITANYVLPNRLSEDAQTISHSLFYNKQPGTDEYPFSFTLLHPEAFSAYKIPSNAKRGKNIVSFLNTITTDQLFETSLTQK